jgi:hypothetical protein
MAMRFILGIGNCVALAVRTSEADEDERALSFAGADVPTAGEPGAAMPGVSAEWFDASPDD